MGFLRDIKKCGRRNGIIWNYLLKALKIKGKMGVEKSVENVNNSL